MLRPYDEYKKIDEVWVEKAPLHWEFKRIKHVLYNRVEKNAPVKTECVLSLSAKNGVELQTEKTEKGGNKPKSDFSKYNIAYEQDLLVNCMNVVSGSSGVSKWYGAISPVYYALHTRNQNSNIRYYHYLFRFKPFYRSLLRFSKGILMHESDNGNLNTVRMRISMESLNNINIPIPPREEQDQIVKYLDWQTSKINTLIKAKKKQIELLKEQKKAVINRAVTKGLDNTVLTKKSGIYWIDSTPTHWTETSLRRILVKLKRKCKISDILLICSNHGYVYERGSAKIGLVSNNEDIYQGVKANDLLIHGMDTWHGAIAISGLDGKCTPVVHVCESSQNKGYVEHYLKMMAYRKIFKAISNGVRQNTSDFRSWDKVGELLICLPPLEEQEQIVQYIYNNNKKVNSIISELEEEIQLSTEYIESLISVVVTGEVDVRGVFVPEFEVVEEIVENTEEDEEEKEEE